MLRDAAVQQVHDGLGFRPLGTPLQSLIINRMLMAQHYMEQGKSLPRFLLRLDETFQLFQGVSKAELPLGFIKESDESRMHFTPMGTDKPFYLSRRYTMDGMRAYILPSSEPTFPRVYAIRLRQDLNAPPVGVQFGPVPGVIDFFVPADKTYTLTWDYYSRDFVLTQNIENNWLRNAPLILIGLTGMYVARDLRDDQALQRFTEVYQEGHKAMFGEIMAQEEASQPLQMGADL